MRILFRPITWAILALGLMACEQNEIVEQKSKTTDLQNFELNSSLAGVHLLELKGEPMTPSEDELRANLHFKGVNEVSTTTFSAADLGIRMNGNTAGNKINARWGVIYGSNKYLAKNCTRSVTEPQLASKENIVYFQPNASQKTLNGAKLKMYCYSAESLNDIKKGWLCLDGVEGAEANSTKQYFMAEQGGRAIKTDPNERIEGVTLGNFQAGRHIPVMTDVVPFAELTNPKANVSFAPRGSLLGLCIENKLGSDIIITSLVVEKAGTFAYSGYFDWSVGSGRASFTAEYTASQNTTALSFPVYTKGSNSRGYTVKNGNTALPCFYLWGMQKEDKKGNAMQVQIRYKLKGSNAEQTSMTFNIYAPESKTERGVKKFDEGYAYNVIIKLNGKNKTGGSNGSEWNNGGVLPVDNGCPNTDKPSGEYTCPTNLTGGKTPLDFLAEYDVNNAANGKKALRTSHSLPKSDQIAELKPTDVGYYTYNEAMAIFNGSNPALNKYILPSRDQINSILPTEKVTISVTEHHPISLSIEYCQVGQLPATNYEAEYITVQEGGEAFVTYALRFKGTEWESAWRYSYEGADGNKQLIIKAVGGLKGRGVKLKCILNEKFFTDNPSTKRVFAANGYSEDNSSISDLDYGTGSYITSSLNVAGNKYFSYGFNYRGPASDYIELTYSCTIRPFKKSL